MHDGPVSMASAVYMAGAVCIAGAVHMADIGAYEQDSPNRWPVRLSPAPNRLVCSRGTGTVALMVRLRWPLWSGTELVAP